jgi:putative flippase GtrA
MLRFGLIGAVNAGVDLAVFFLALAMLTSSLVLANAIAWAVAVTGSYILNARYTFAHADRGMSFAGYLMFALTQAGGFAVHTLVLIATAPFLPLLAAKVLGIGVGFLVNFTLARTFVFHAR